MAGLARSPDTATAEDLRGYQLYLVDHGISPISLNATITGLKFFFETTIEHPQLMVKMHPVPVPREIPLVLSYGEAARLIGAAGNLKNQTALSVAYGTGLRVSEVVCPLDILPTVQITIMVRPALEVADIRFDTRHLNDAVVNQTSLIDTSSDTATTQIPIDYRVA